jgi:hypothetical protein
MSLSPDYYPPFDPHELPANPSPRMARALEALYRASVEIHRTLYRLALLHEITRSALFVAKINNTPIAFPMLTIRSGLTYSVVMSLTAVFGIRDTAASLRPVLKALVDSREEPGIRRLHATTGIDPDLALARLRRLHKRLNSEDIRSAIVRLTYLRDRQLAHFNLRPPLEPGATKMADIDRVFAFAANTVNTATAVAVKRLLTTRDSYEDARHQACEFTAALIRAPAATAP